MGFLFVDRLLSDPADPNVRGIKHITAEDHYLMPTSNGRFAFLPALLGETMGQLGAWHVMHQLDFQQRPVAGVVKSVEIHDMATLGDSVFIDTTIERLDADMVLYHSEARCNDRLIMRINDALGPLVAMEDFIDQQTVREQFQKIARPGVWPTMLEAQLIPTSPTIIPIQYDHILEWQSGERVVAQKLINASAPYFSDHFPRKPVFPLTLLLQCNMDLGERFLRDTLTLTPVQSISAVQLQKIKMNAFVQPGDVLQTECVLKNTLEQTYTLQFRSTVEGNRVCVAQAEFTLQG